MALAGDDSAAPIVFTTAAAFHTRLEEHHATATELRVGFFVNSKEHDA